MGSLGVTILIKAPNQMVEDQAIQCERNWTVKELKQHLSVVYPSKPNPEGQKLIYSGKLLADATVLSDVLRTHDGHENNTIHLVCSQKDSMRAPVKPVFVPKEKVENVNTTTSTPNPSPFITTTATNTTTVAESDNTPLNGYGVDMQRRYATPLNANANQFMYGYPHYYTQEHMQRQMMWLQQAYMQYMSQYMPMSNMVNYYPRYEQNEVSVENQQNENPNEDPDNNAEDEMEEEGQANRDWLEWLFIIKRLLVLFSFVYLYSSPMRFILVVSMTLILFHVDIERWRRRNAEEVPEPINEPEVPNDAVADRPHWLAVFWTFFSSFFLSLIPDQRDIH